MANGPGEAGDQRAGSRVWYRVVCIAGKWLLAMLVLVAVIRLMRVSVGHLVDVRFHWQAKAILTAGITGLSYYLLNAFSWHRLTVALNISRPWPESFRIWIRSSFGKYLPGKVWVFAGRAAQYRIAGFSLPRIGAALWLEMHLRVAAALCVFLVAWTPDLTTVIDSRLRWVCGIILVVLLGSLHPRVLAGVGKRLAHLRHQPPPVLPSTLAIAAVFFLEVLAWLVGGIGVHAVMSLIADLPLSEVLHLSGAIALGGVFGFVAVFVPAGLGVREATFAGLVGLIVAPEIAVVGAAAVRIWATGCELVLGGATFLMRDKEESDG